MPNLDSLIDTEESSIELTDADFDNEEDNEDFVDTSNDYDYEGDISEIEDVKDSYTDFSSFNQTEEKQDTDSNVEYEDSTNTYNVENTEQNEEQDEKLQIKKKKKIRSKKDFDIKKYYKYFIYLIIILSILITAIIVLKIVKKAKTRSTPKQENKIEKQAEVQQNDNSNTEGSSSFEIYKKDETYFVKIKLNEDNSGIFQSVYKQDDNKYVVCETVENDYSKNEMKEVELSCYNLNSDENLNNLEKIQETFIQQ